MNDLEWMTSSQAKERFGMTFKILIASVKEGLIRAKVIPNAGGNDKAGFLFNVSDVRDYIDSLESA